MKGPRQSAATWTRAVRGLLAFRIASGPLVLWLLLADRRLAATCLFVCGCLTDGLDGYLAKRGGGVSGASSYADPAADFVLSGCALLAFVLGGVYPWWTLAVVVGMFAQFVATSGREGPRYDAVGKYYGVFLYAADLLTLFAPTGGVRSAVLVGLLAFSALSASCRFVPLQHRR